VKKIIKFCDFIDRVIIKCFLECVFVGIFSFLAMLAASTDGMCVYKIKKKRDGAASS
jgi:hypothetical protein